MTEQLMFLVVVHSQVATWIFHAQNVDLDDTTLRSFPDYSVFFWSRNARSSFCRLPRGVPVAGCHVDFLSVATWSSCCWLPRAVCIAGCHAEQETWCYTQRVTVTGPVVGHFPPTPTAENPRANTSSGTSGRQCSVFMVKSSMNRSSSVTLRRASLRTPRCHVVVGQIHP